MERMHQGTDQELLEAYHNGDEQAFAHLVERYLGPLFRFLVRMVGDRGIAEDLVQEVFVKAWKRMSSFDMTKSFKTWIFTIAKHTAIDYLRKQKRTWPFVFSFDEGGDGDERSMMETVADPRPLVSVLLEDKERAASLDMALAALSDEGRTVVLLHDGEDMTFQEIADMLKKPMNTVKSRYRRSLEALRTRLSGSSMHQSSQKNV